MIKSSILALVIIAIGMSFDFRNLEFKLEHLAYFIDLPSLLIVVIQQLVYQLVIFLGKPIKKHGQSLLVIQKIMSNQN